MSKQTRPVTAAMAWASCSIREFGRHVGGERHLTLILSGGTYDLTTLCGDSASVPGIWRRNTRKPKCKICKEYEGVDQ